MSWYYVSNGKQAGPVSDDEIQGLVASGAITAGTLVWKDGMPDWKPWSEVRASIQENAAVSGGNLTCECGKVLPKDEMVKIGGHWYCPACKDTAVQRLREGVISPVSLNYGGFWIRFGAKIIDGLILMVINFTIQIVFGIVGGFKEDSPLAIVLMILAFVLQIAVQAGYNIYFLGSRGATPGKMACGLKVVRSDGAPLTYGHAGKRFLAEIVTGFTFGIGYIIAAFDDQRRTLHDRLVETRVVHV